MTALIKTLATGALQDRKGVTALEYALIAAAVVSVVLVAYNTMFGKLETFINSVSFS
jgi:Flp pilus assembly pilin Flp